MPLKQALYITDELQNNLSARAATGEALSRPLKRTLDRAFEMLDAERRELNGKYSEAVWKLFLSVLKRCDDIRDFTDCINDAHLQVGPQLGFSNIDVAGIVSEADNMNYSRKWAILDVVERFHAAGDIEASAEGLKKLGILCREEN